MKRLTISALLILVTALVLAGCGKSAPAPKSQTELKPQATAKESVIPTTPMPDALTPENVRSITQAPPLMKFTGTPYMTIKVKGYGTIKIQLDPKAAPQNVSNVYQLAKAGFYDGIVFHRIIKDFMIQTGDPTGTGSGGPRYTVPAELVLKNIRGAVAMARTNNPAKASSSCQFYIILKDQPNLDASGYTVIGNVVSGMNVVDKIGNVPVRMTMSGERSAPVTPVVMEQVTVEEK